jgi:hypothetical protein
MECLNPLRETFGFEPYKTTSFRKTLRHMKGEAESMQDQEQIDKTDKWKPSQI